jgi:hypothetical protein
MNQTWLRIPQAVVVVVVEKTEGLMNQTWLINLAQAVTLCPYLVHQWAAPPVINSRFGCSSGCSVPLLALLF